MGEAADAGDALLSWELGLVWLRILRRVQDFRSVRLELETSRFSRLVWTLGHMRHAQSTACSDPCTALQQGLLLLKLGKLFCYNISDFNILLVLSDNSSYLKILYKYKKLVLFKNFM